MKKSVSFLVALMAALFLLPGSIFAAPSVLQTQYGPDGLEIDLLSAKVSGDVLSVSMMVRNPNDSGGTRVTFAIEDVNYIDNIKSQKYSVLKDEKGKWLAAPLSELKRGKEKLFGTSIYLSKGARNVLWYKFPAPPEGVSKIQINIPEFSPFNDVEISR